MPPKRKSKEKKPSKSCTCGDNCHEESHLPGLLLAAFGVLGLQANFDLIDGAVWLKAWPLFVVLIGVVLMAKVSICRSRS